MKLQSLGGNDDGEVRQGAAFRADRGAYLKKRAAATVKVCHAANG